MAEAIDVISNLTQAAALLDPTRLRLVEHLAEPHSAASLARKLKLPRQRVNYHLRELEKVGLVEMVEEKRRGNCIERIVRATARSYLIGPEALGRLGSEPGQVRDRLSSGYLIAVAARTIRDLAALRRRAESLGRRLATLTLETEIRFESSEARSAFAEELASMLAQLTVKYHRASSPGGRTFRFFLGGYPAVPALSKEG
jgi:DNA-binding transcriptional ArsR family regulator